MSRSDPGDGAVGCGGERRVPLLHGEMGHPPDLVSRLKAKRTGSSPRYRATPSK